MYVYYVECWDKSIPEALQIKDLLKTIVTMNNTEISEYGEDIRYVLNLKLEALFPSPYHQIQLHRMPPKSYVFCYFENVIEKKNKRYVVQVCRTFFFDNLNFKIIL